MGDACIPGRRYQPKDPENLPFECSQSLCFHRNSTSSSLFGIPSALSMMLGYKLWCVSAQGQKPSCSPLQTDSTKGQFGCDSSSSSKWWTLIGVTILKRCWFSLMVFIAQTFSNSMSGTKGKGSAISVQAVRHGGADVLLKFASSSLLHILYRRYFGCMPYAESIQLSAAALSMPALLAFKACVSVSAGAGCAAAPLCSVEVPAGFGHALLALISICESCC